MAEGQMGIEHEKVDIRLVLTTRPPENGRPVMIPCTAHKDNVPTLGVFRDNINCFNPACRFHISRRYEALAYLLNLWDGQDEDTKFAAAMKARARASEFMSANVEVRPDTERGPIHPAIAQGFMRNLWDNPRRKHRLQYLYDRGFTDEWIKRGQIGHDSTRFTIPVFDQYDLLRNVRYRTDPMYDTRSSDDDRVCKYCGVIGRNSNMLYPEWILARTETDTIWVTEGELDALLLWQHGVPAVSMINGASQVRRVIPQLVEKFPDIKRLVICTDMDVPGYAAAMELKQACDESGWFKGVQRIIWPVQWGKDITEVLSNGYRLEQLTREDTIR